jgi:predicted methyltransferase
MTLKKYIKQLQSLAKRHPKAVVVYDDGKTIKRVKYFPMRGNLTKGRFSGEDTLKINAVCLN